jgi:hypothetical protein
MSMRVLGSEVRLVRGLSDNFIGNQAGSALGSSILGQNYKPEWKMRGSLCL